MSQGFEQVLTGFQHLLAEYQRKNPHVAAFAELKAGKRAESSLLDAHAAELFEEIRRENPEDPFALHHLAIIYHGSGYQAHLDQRNSAKEVVEFWRLGLEAWVALLQHDGFWNTLRDRWKRRHEAAPEDMLADRLARVDLDAFRRQIPAYLLKLHAGFVEELCRREPEAALRHMEIILASGFDTALVQRTRKDIYENIVGDISALSQKLQGEQARERLRVYLAIDGDFLAAHCDRLRLCALECERLGKARENFDERTRWLKEAEPSAAHCAVQQTAKSELFVADAIRDYYLAHATLAQHRASSGNGKRPVNGRLWEEAHDWAFRAVTLERVGCKAHQQFNLTCGNGALAILNGGTDLRIAKKLVDAGLVNDSREPWLHAILAYYYRRNGQTAEYQRQLMVAEKINAELHDSAGRQILSDLRSTDANERQHDETVQKIEELLEAASDAFQHNRYAKALKYFEQLDPFFERLPVDVRIQICLGRFQCYRDGGGTDEAKACLRKARNLLESGTDPMLRAQVTALSNLFS